MGNCSNSNRPTGWNSRRHQTNEAEETARAEKEGRVSAQIERSEARDVAAKARTPQEQIARLDAQLGKGKGAVRERARLQRKITLGSRPTPAAKATKAVPPGILRPATKAEQDAMEAHYEGLGR